jgi:hypothetical protein
MAKAFCESSATQKMSMQRFLPMIVLPMRISRYTLSDRCANRRATYAATRFA